MLLQQNSVIDVSVDFRQPCLRGMHLASPLGNRPLLHPSPALGIYVAFLGEGRGVGYEYFLELRIIIVTDLVPCLFEVISFNIITI